MAVNTSSVTVAWVPAVREECVHHYSVCLTDMVTLAQECHNRTDLYHTFTDLKACVDYQATVTPVAPSGNRGSLTYDSARTADLPTSAPTSLRVTDIAAHSALVSFAPPLENPLCVKEYDIEVEEMGSVKSSKVPSASVFLEQLLSGLDACNNFEVRISAVTASGHKSENLNGNFTTGEDTPSAPRALTHITAAGDHVLLHWFSPLVNRLCVDLYRVSWNSSSDSGTVDYIPSGHPPEASVTVSGLAGCTPYTFTVSAVTPLGDEGPSASYTVTTSC